MAGAGGACFGANYLSPPQIPPAVVQPADIQDRDAGLDLLVGADREFPRLELLWVDGAYAGEFEDWIQTHLGWRVVVVRKLAQQVGFRVLPVRWRVEQTLAWLGRNRRLAKDYEGIGRVQ